MNPQFYLSSNGNLLVIPGTDPLAFFMTADFQFIRLVSKNEQEDLTKYFNEISFVNHFGKLPTVSLWKYLWCVTQETIQWVETTHFFGRVNNNKIQFCKFSKKRDRTSMSDDNGKFCNWEDLKYLPLIGIESVSDITWEYVSSEKHHEDGAERALDQVATSVPIKEVFEAQDNLYGQKAEIDSKRHTSRLEKVAEILELPLRRIQHELERK